jgi:hypothetical protein
VRRGDLASSKTAVDCAGADWAGQHLDAPSSRGRVTRFCDEWGPFSD